MQNIHMKQNSIFFINTLEGVGLKKFNDSKAFTGHF